MIPTTEAPQFTNTLLGLLQQLAPVGARGTLRLRWRTLHGIGTDQFIIRPGLTELPLPLLDFLDEGLEIRSPLVTGGDDGRPVALTAGAVLFKPATLFNTATNYRYAVDPAAAEQIRATLGAFPLRPAYITDAAHEVVAWWPLRDPLPVDRDPAPALALLEALAKHLTANLDAARSFASLYPLCGIVRNWTCNPPERIELLAVAPGAAYSVQDLLEAISEKPDPSASPGARSRKTNNH